MYNFSPLHASQNQFFILTVFCYVLPSPRPPSLFSNVNNGHYHRLHLYYVINILYQFILTLLSCTYYFYVCNNAMCVTPLLLPFCIIQNSFVKCLLYIHLDILLPYKKSNVGILLSPSIKSIYL